MSAGDDPTWNVRGGGNTDNKGISEHWTHVDFFSQDDSSSAGPFIAVADFMGKGNRVVFVLNGSY